MYVCCTGGCIIFNEPLLPSGTGFHAFCNAVSLYCPCLYLLAARDHSVPSLSCVSRLGELRMSFLKRSYVNKQLK